MRRKPRGLRPEEEALWRIVAGRAEPLLPRKPQAKLRSRPQAVKSSTQPHPPQPPAFAQFRVGEAVRPAPRVQTGGNKTPVLMDNKAYHKLTRGKLKPEARIDLHGMTLAQAHPVLTGFVLSAHRAQRRLVLVITGKGKAGDDEGPIPVRHGVLRHQVPHWLHTPPLASVVLQVTQAHQRHGGAGAYYVYLRRVR